MVAIDKAGKQDLVSRADNGNIRMLAAELGVSADRRHRAVLLQHGPVCDLVPAMAVERLGDQRAAADQGCGHSGLLERHSLDGAELRARRRCGQPRPAATASAACARRRLLRDLHAVSCVRSSAVVRVGDGGSAVRQIAALCGFRRTKTGGTVALGMVSRWQATAWDTLRALSGGGVVSQTGPNLCGQRVAKTQPACAAATEAAAAGSAAGSSSAAEASSIWV